MSITPIGETKANPTKFTMIEDWDSLESHQESVKTIPLIPQHCLFA